jgi:CheY-like chemotaxis protein
MSKDSQSNILVVEDDQALNDAYKAILSSVGYNVETSFNGQEALDLLAGGSFVPDVILLDLRMPVLDGVGFLREYKPKQHPETTVVVFSNYDSHKDIDEAYELGVDRYVLKARAAPKDLLHLIEGILTERASPVA